MRHRNVNGFNLLRPWAFLTICTASLNSDVTTILCYRVGSKNELVAHCYPLKYSDRNIIDGKFDAVLVLLVVNLYAISKRVQGNAQPTTQGRNAPPDA